MLAGLVVVVVVVVVVAVVQGDMYARARGVVFCVSHVFVSHVLFYVYSNWIVWCDLRLA